MTGIDLHLHTTFCDGKNTPEEMVKKAIELGVECLGIAVHGHTPFDEEECVSKAGTKQFLKEIARLKKAYARELWILAGVEQDHFGDVPTKGFDYVIGSAHYVECKGEHYPVDLSRESFEETARIVTGGDYYRLAELYYEMVGGIVDRTGADIIGHFDLIAKYNENGAFFDENDPRYVAAWKSAADRLLRTGKPFEINTGAISRGVRTTPYPSKEIRAYLKERGAKFLLSSDAHRAEDLLYAFPSYEAETDPEAYDFLEEL